MEGVKRKGISERRIGCPQRLRGERAESIPGIESSCIGGETWQELALEM